eukprot:gene56594-17023_t
MSAVCDGTLDGWVQKGDMRDEPPLRSGTKVLVLPPSEHYSPDAHARMDFSRFMDFPCTDPTQTYKAVSQNTRMRFEGRTAWVMAGAHIANIAFSLTADARTYPCDVRGLRVLPDTPGTPIVISPDANVTAAGQGLQRLVAPSGAASSLIRPVIAPSIPSTASAHTR